MPAWTWVCTLVSDSSNPGKLIQTSSEVFFLEASERDISPAYPVNKAY